jgi:hypothetical protein
MNESKPFTAPNLDDLDDDIPDMTTPYWAAKIAAAPMMPGRPKSAAPKVSTTIRLDADVLAAFKAEGEYPELCVSCLAHAGFRYGHALKRSSNMIANWFLAANHSRTFLPPFSKLRIAR